jgi:hypothetical protein
MSSLVRQKALTPEIFIHEFWRGGCGGESHSFENVVLDGWN